jgi:hypothetical protein
MQQTGFFWVVTPLSSVLQVWPDRSAFAKRLSVIFRVASMRGKLLAISIYKGYCPRIDCSATTLIERCPMKEATSCYLAFLAAAHQGCLSIL